MNLVAIREFAKNVLEGDKTGHDWNHALRVEKNVHKIMPPGLDEAELEVIRAACWLHDTIDKKLAQSRQKSVGEIEELLVKNGATLAQIDEVLDIIQNLSYSKNLETKKELSLAGQIVQDADRLDAIGAIGIGRAFYYGGSQGDAMYTDDVPRSLEKLTASNYRKGSSVLNHFYEKLLLLESQMNTEAGKFEAKKRTNFMKKYLEQLAREI
ncbi:MAG TPA: HD domain-containing protein [Atopostipes sp.]|nr:HD domain-containing protein [Atopostipes sp.]